jgi:hypothetical protein
MDKTVEICYDRFRDVLFGLIRPEPQIQAEPVAIDLYLLHDRSTGTVVGLECDDFSEHVQDGEWLNTIPEIRPFYDLREPAKMWSLSEILVHLKEEIGCNLTDQQPALALRNVMAAS